jgi:lysophospholipase L1-like esterase
MTFMHITMTAFRHLPTLPITALLFASALFAETPKDVWPKPKPTKHDYAKWEKTIAGFEQKDKETPPPKGAVLFVGSSTIVRWKSLAADYPGVTVLNRGFGGNQIKDSTYYAERMIFPYEPKAIFLRAGGNDINAGWPAEDVFEDYKKFVAKVRARFPNIPITYIGLSPTIKRIAQIAEGNKLNDLIAAYCKENTGLVYIDCKDLTLGADGQPRPELFVEDMLHFSEAGYKLLAERVRPHLPK